MLLADLTDRVQRGEPVDLEQVCREHKEFAEDLRELWGAILVADAIGSDSRNFETLPADTPDHAFSLPRQFGDYELLEEIGRGGMGVVYKARQLTLNRIVAVKMILRGQLATPSDRERFRAEAEAAAKLSHPNIVPVYQVGEIDGRPYFSMKYIEGQTLSERLAAGPSGPREIAELMVPVCRAIHFAHRQGVLHRDLKPSNIIVDADGQPHVMDFGLAKRSADAASLTRTGAVIGTPAYMAPEQAAGTRAQVGPTSDVYSLGTILYHMLTGQPPFQADSPVNLVMKVIEQDPPVPRFLNPRADRDLEMICVRSMQKPADLRYVSAAALADDLDAYLRDEPISARSGRLLQVLSRMFRETHHAEVLENWGLLWMWHSLALLVACSLTNVLYWYNIQDRRYYFVLWTVGFGAWASVFWALRRRLGPVTFVERQIAHVWFASMVSIAALFPLEAWLGLPVLKLSPVLGLISCNVFLVKAGILSGAFYVQAFAMLITAGVMALLPDYAHFIFGATSAACFFFPGLKYYRQSIRAGA
ncbi:MAG: serine/threonine protein kinase [Planctomycetales bacterium]|nr:serine/threonine protein kinase [Planctomycetales bacterium]MCA9224348.1 serine/threonine protein kinase [Planctomycetales bacterium]